jgi:hypothetical protein
VLGRLAPENRLDLLPQRDVLAPNVETILLRRAEETLQLVAVLA